jgi:hypothetical protein
LTAETSDPTDTAPTLGQDRVTDSAADQEPTGLADEPERRFTYGGKVAHLIAAGTDFSVFPYATAYCGRQPQWGVAWLGSGTWQETQDANRLPTCKRCNAVAAGTKEFIDGLRRDLGMAPK